MVGEINKNTGIPEGTTDKPSNGIDGFTSDTVNVIGGHGHIEGKAGQQSKDQVPVDGNLGEQVAVNTPQSPGQPSPKVRKIDEHAQIENLGIGAYR